MTESEYKDTVRDFCQCVGIDDWQNVVETNHIQVGGRCVGLLYSKYTHLKKELLIYIDLGVVYERDRLIFWKKMLEANIQPESTLTGCFGIHPEIGHAIYHQRIEIPLCPAELARQIDSLVSNVEQRFVAISRS